MAPRSRRLTSAAATGLAVAVALGGASVLGGVAAHRSTLDARIEIVEHVVQDDAVHLQSELERVELAARALAEGPATRGVAAFRAAAPAVIGGTAVRAIALAGTDDARRWIVTTVVPAPASPLRRGAVVDAPEVLERAVAQAEPIVGHAEGVLLVVAPASRAGPDASIAEQRAATSAVVVGIVDVASVAERLFDGADVRVSAGDFTVYERGDPSGRLLRATVGDPPWLIEADPTTPGVGWVPWAIAVIGLLLAAAAGGLVARSLRGREAAERHLDSRTEQLGRIAEAGARVQQTLELGELLPAFALALVDDFDLCHVAISVVDDDNHEVEVFTYGDPTGGTQQQHLALRRGLRRVGTLSVRPMHPPDDATMTSLQALGDLLAVALTNSRLLQREQDAAGRLRELDALKNAFLGTVSHELRTSMTAIMGFGELLADAWDEMPDERRRELAERVRRAAGSLRYLVDDLLDFARLEQHRLQVSPRPVDLAKIVRQTVDSLRSLLVQHQLEILADGPVPAHVDPLAVERIVANLLSNASKYSPPGTTVTVRVGTVADRARLIVDDEGSGIPEAERVRIFARFYRLDTPETIRARGAGIGLSILHDFAQRSRAPVSVEDAPSGGARFVVDFPTMPEPVAEDDPLAERVS